MNEIQVPIWGTAQENPDKASKIFKIIKSLKTKIMKTQNIDNQTSLITPKKDWGKVVSLVTLGIFIVPVFVAMAASALGPSNMLEDMETVYERQQDEISRTLALLHEQTETLCLQEVSIAKKKAEDHYAGRTVLTPEELERIILKAEGRNLACRSVFTTASR